jgi:hypothetical protein
MSGRSIIDIGISPAHIAVRGEDDEVEAFCVQPILKVALSCRFEGMQSLGKAGQGEHVVLGWA